MNQRFDHRNKRAAFRRITMSNLVSSVFSPALNQLRWMLAGAVLRNARKKLSSPLGALMGVVMLLFVVGGFVPFLFIALHGDGIGSLPVNRFMLSSSSFLFFVFTAYVIANDLGKALVELYPPELQFVLAGPFSNRQILAYRICTLGMGLLPSCFLFGLFCTPIVGGFFQAFAALFLAGSLLIVIAVLRALLTPSLSSRTTDAIRWSLYAGLSLSAIELSLAFRRNIDGLSWESAEAIVQNAWCTRLFGFPFLSIGGLFNADSTTQWCVSALIVSGLTLVGIVACDYLNAGFAEIAVEGVGRRQQKIARLKGGDTFGGVTVKANRKPKYTPDFSWLMGVGPIAWNQVVMARRKSGGIIRFFGMLSVVAIVAGLVLRYRYGIYPQEQSTKVLPIVMGVVLYLSFLISFFLALGYSGSRRLDQIYAMIPVSPFSLAVGMTAGSTFVLWCIRLAVFFPAMVFENESGLACLGVLSAGMAMDLALTSSINLVSAATGLRLMPDGAPDIFHGVRAMWFMLLVTLAMLPAITCATISALIGLFAFDFRWGGCGMLVAITLVMAQPLNWLLTSVFFDRREHLA